MQTVELSSEKRTLSTKGALRQLRLSGRVPATIYGGKKDPVSAHVNAKDLSRLLKSHGTNMLLNLKTETGTDMVLLQELQREMLTHEPIHADFRRISLTEKLEVSIPLHVKGEAPGVKTEGGIMEHVLRDLRIKCLPADIPAAIDIDVSGLHLNQVVKVKDLVLPKGGIEVLLDADQVILTISAPVELKVEPVPGAAAAPGAAAEPEVIAKGKKPEEGAEGAAPVGKDGKPAAPAAKDAKAAAPAKK